jgi:negative regulator of flagellin synthesis FlgM
MKIGPTETKPVSTPTTASPAKDRAATPAAASGVAGSEPSAKVELSTAASLLGTSQADPTFDTAKVDRIAQAIRDGNFQVDAEAIADKLIVNAAELLGSKPS